MGTLTEFVGLLLLVIGMLTGFGGCFVAAAQDQNPVVALSGWLAAIVGAVLLTLSRINGRDSH